MPKFLSLKALMTFLMIMKIFREEEVNEKQVSAPEKEPVKKVKEPVKKKKKRLKNHLQVIKRPKKNQA